MKIGLLFILLIGAFISAHAHPDLEIKDLKLKLSQILNKKFGYTGSVLGSYGFSDKLVDPEDLEAHRDLINILSGVTSPKSLAKYKSIYIGTEQLRASVRADEKSETLFFMGKKLDSVLVIGLISKNPDSETILKKIKLEKRNKYQNILKDHLSRSLHKSFFSIYENRCLNIHKTYDQFKEAMISQDYELLPKNILKTEDYSDILKKNLEGIIHAANKKEESTLRFEGEDKVSAIIFFDKGNIQVTLVSKSDEQMSSFQISDICEIENLMVRNFEGEKVKRVLHFDSELKITKRVYNNQQRIIVKNRNTSHTTAVAILDSGLDYNHPDVAGNLLPSNLTQEEIKYYEQSKDHFINDHKWKIKLQKKRAEIDIKFNSLKLLLGFSEENLSKHKELLSKLSKERRELDASIKKNQEIISINEPLIKNIKTDKLLAFKSSKSAKLRELTSQVHKAELELSSIKYSDQRNKKAIADHRIKEQQLYEKHQNLLKQKDERLAEIALVEKEELAHQKMLDVFTRGVSAWNFHDNNDTPSDFWDGFTSILFNSYDHGTHVAGIILKGAENELSVFPMRYPKQHFFDLENEKERKVSQAIELAYNKGIRIINISMGTFAQEAKTPEEKAKYDASARASWKALEASASKYPDMLFVCAAGNDGKNTDERGHYHSGFENSNILSVAAVDANNKLAEFSNYGKVTVDLAAPGVDILSTVPNGEVGTKSGTSMATPYASRVAAMIKHINPKLSPIEIKDILAQTVKKTSELQLKTLYGGVIDEKMAIKKACSTVTSHVRLQLVKCK
jgi:subtilisin family serine protease